MTAQQLQAGLLALERLRGEVDDAVLDLALTALHDRLDALRAGDQPEQRLRQATVLFVDVVGSTALGGRLDPEDIHLVMDTALARFTAIVERHNGRVLQYAGDSLLAAFGTLAVREDDAENAVLAGLAIVDEAALQGERVRREHGHPGFHVRVGLHSGPVLLGGGVDAANTIRGATVNLAARMEQSAVPGTVRISAATQRLVQGQFETQEQPPLQVKGHEAPLQTYVVIRRLPRGEFGIGRGTGWWAPLLGRDDTMAALQAAWQDPARQMAGVCIVRVAAEAGLGKTRLVHEWRLWAQAGATPALWLVAAARPQHQQVPSAFLRELLAGALNLPESDSPAAARQRFVGHSVPLLAPELGADEATAECHVLGHFLGLNFSDSPHVRDIAQKGAQIRQRALHTATRLLAALARSADAGRLVLCLDDLQWADDASLDYLRGLAQRSIDVPLFVLASARPDLDERLPGWAAAETLRLTLAPLSVAASRALAQELLKPLRPPSQPLCDLLVERADGNPFYMEALLQMLFDLGTVQRSPRTDGPWTLQAPALELQQVPTTLNGVLQARLDALPGAERTSLQEASVLGLAFWRDTLAALDALAPAQLPPLAQRGLLRQRARLAQDSAEEHEFTHAFLQHVSYGRLLRRDRQALHALAAQWYAELQTATAPDYLPVAAEHHFQAGQPIEAARFHLLAAENLAGRFAHGAVVGQATLGLARAADEDHATRWALLLLRQRALRLSGQREQQAADLDALAALAQRTADPLHVATVALRLAVAADETGHPLEAAALAPQALTAARQAGDLGVELAVYGVWAGALHGAGRHTQAREVAQEGLLRAQLSGEGEAPTELLVVLAAVATEQGDAVGSQALLRQALALQQRRGDRAAECTSRINLAAAAMRLADFDSARSDLDAAMALVRLTGNRTLELSARLNLATTLLSLGQLPEAHAGALAVCKLAQDVQNPEQEAYAWMTLGAVLLEQGELPAAQTAFARSGAMLDELGMAHMAIEAVAWLARVSLLQGDLPAALRDVERVLAHRQQHGHFDGTEKPLLIRLTCCEVLRAVGDARAHTELLDSWAELQAFCSKLGDTAARERVITGHAHHAALRHLAIEAGLA